MTEKALLQVDSLKEQADFFHFVLSTIGEISRFLCKRLVHRRNKQISLRKKAVRNNGKHLHALFLRNDKTNFLSLIMERGGCIYIMTNKNKTTLYIGVSSDLPKRLVEHRSHLYPKSFTAKYNLTYCIYYEAFFSVEEAIAREKEIKKWRREKKDTLINQLNPNWDDLSESIGKW